ncbi:unnamed protein product [Protopolystoma xenopodis]|uniref:Uncharacterized protein n=1 Tax=Protopolystoma xenopodis TaxID=117903 RepID=A0A3S5AIF1_9PLAT|nr:unnamed protein product [Protopolystoma xenopodis]
MASHQLEELGKGPAPVSKINVFFVHYQRMSPDSDDANSYLGGVVKALTLSLNGTGILKLAFLLDFVEIVGETGRNMSRALCSLLCLCCVVRKLVQNVYGCRLQPELHQPEESTRSSGGRLLRNKART